MFSNQYTSNRSCIQLFIILYYILLIIFFIIFFNILYLYPCMCGFAIKKCPCFLYYSFVCVNTHVCVVSQLFVYIFYVCVNNTSMGGKDIKKWYFFIPNFSPHRQTKLSNPLLWYPGAIRNIQFVRTMSPPGFHTRFVKNQDKPFLSPPPRFYLSTLVIIPFLNSEAIREP